jgi:peroxiredoxin Q/BCP
MEREENFMPEIGEKAPDFNLLDQNRNRIVLSKALKKGKALLVFYPKDATPVCTAQLCDYRDHYSEFQQLGVQVFGITINHPEEHTAFAEKHHFPFPLLNDYDSRVTHAYDVMSIFGMPKRALFLIGEDQRVLYKHVELLPVFRRSSQELIPALAEKLGVSPPPVSTASHSSHSSHAPGGH